jgi:predicted nucleic-acid-binding protein
MSLIDTNVIIRFLTGSSDEKFKGVFDFFKAIEQGKIAVELRLIVLFQVIFVLKCFYKVPKGEIAKAIRDLLKLKGLKIKEKRTIFNMMNIWNSNNVEIVDAYLIACVDDNPENILYSYDKDFDRFKIHRVEP